MSITTVGNQLIHYEVLGRGKPLIFIHGWLGSWRYWWPSMQAMSSQYRSFAFDLWGFGDSSKAPDMYSVPAYVDMLNQFITQLGVAPPVVLIGHSLGGVVALHYTQQFSENVDKVITVSLPVNGSTVDGRLTNTDPDTFLSRFLNSSSNYSEVDAEIRKTDPAAFNKLAAELSSSSQINLLNNFPRPVLMLHGLQDTVVQPPVNGHDTLNQKAENRFFVTLDDCAHFPMLQEKAKFNRLLLEFIIAGDKIKEITAKDFWKRRMR